VAELELTPIGGALGATVGGLDQHGLEAPGLIDELRGALREHHVLFFPGLDPSVEALRDLGARCGPLEVHPYIEKVAEDIPEVCVLDTSATPKADIWHTDVTYSEHPPIAAMLHMVECPPWGGDTMWINCHGVYDSLSIGLRQFLATLTCIHDDGRQGSLQAEHPVVRIHPDTGRPALYVNKQHGRRIPQLSRPESQMLLAFLYKWQEQVKFSCRWHWQPGDVALWDERVTLHVMVDDTHERRLMRRVTVLGDDPQALSPDSMAPRAASDQSAASGFYGIGGDDF